MKRQSFIIKNINNFSMVIICCCFFLPWLENESITLSGIEFSKSLYKIPILIVISSLLSIYATIRNKNKLILPIINMLPCLLYITLISIIITKTNSKIFLDNDSQNLTIKIPLILDKNDMHFQIYKDIGLAFFIGFFASWVPFITQLIKSMYPFSLKHKKQYRMRYITINIAIIILIFTYFWCNISPFNLWENRKNAYQYLFGKQLSSEDMQSIQKQVNKAPFVYSNGQARQKIRKKYQNLPSNEQPTYSALQKEIKHTSLELYNNMTEKKKELIKEQVRKDLLIDKQGGFFPLEISSTHIKHYIMALLETLAMAIWGTLLAAITAIPLAVIAAENTFKLIITGESYFSGLFRKLNIVTMRRFLDSCRGFNEFVMALIFVAVIGLGPFAGILALWIHTLGILGKIFSEQIEAIENGPVEALISTGASPIHVIVYSVLPQVLPGFISYTLLRFESNVRSAAVLGFVGAGGIGFLIFDKLNGYMFREVSTIMLLIIVTVSLIDFTCTKIRRKFI